ncbi:uncharacterized protein K444DRAFT_49624 [Hyaloscypha bicolor E]|uniref:F-box domain-containing protein n=1 Tax=Hyaloscypha bicolor E TaxID=1095630 RepID=A0A2J6T2J4_9HELO|nr:uncharacterized protein K444DRAFT_49624 [Hyaloscypha bicolor E]PMD57236.1 hypothetical protein K444DRAFT_49624 [Hyaloscypha bicolor E]
MMKILVHNVPDEILLQICSSLTSHELYQLSLSCRALSRVAFEVFSRAIKLDYAYRDDGSLSHLNGFITKLERRSGGFLSGINIAHLSWPIGSELRRRMHYILSILPNIQTLNLKEHFGSLRGFFIGSGGLDENLITAHDILKLFAMKQLEHLSLDGFNYAMGIEPGEEVPHSQLQSLTISTSANPTGRHIDIILARTPKLRKFTWNFDLSSTLNQEAIRRALSPAAMGEALSPLRSSLEELYISMAPSRFRSDSTSLNLSNFLKLRILKVHEEVLFPSYNELGYVVFCRGLEAQLYRV